LLVQLIEDQIYLGGSELVVHLTDGLHVALQKQKGDGRWICGAHRDDQFA
jgi:hypothetical protein